MSMGQDDPGSLILAAVQAIVIRPEDARALVDKYVSQCRTANPSASERRRQELCADKIISRYCRLSATSGGAAALAGIVPGLGTAAATLGGGMTDAAVTMKLQVDMCVCLAHNFHWDLDAEDARHLAFLIAAGAALERAGAEAVTLVASEAGVRMLRLYLRGSALLTMKELFKKLGVVFTRKAIEKAIPFGVGVVVSASANYALTSYIGHAAKGWFVIDRDERDGASPA